MLSQNRRLLLFVAIGLSDIIMSLVFLLLFGRTATLTCRRPEPRQVVCEQKSTLFGRIMSGPKTLSGVRGAQVGESEDEDGTTYRVELLTDQGVEPFSGWYTSDYKRQRELADQINAFVEDTQQQSTEIEHKPEVWLLIAIGVFGAVGLGVMLVGPLAAALRRIRDNTSNSL
ncbi:MAG: hypothetical protein JW934_00305 [Anaerolineae bacterium]|nr:hypothetical protein [Anaerolineae bacterium]